MPRARSVKPGRDEHRVVVGLLKIFEILNKGGQPRCYSLLDVVDLGQIICADVFQVISSADLHANLFHFF